MTSDKQFTGQNGGMGNGNGATPPSTGTEESKVARLAHAAREKAMVKADTARTRVAERIEEYAGLLDKVAGTFAEANHPMSNDVAAGAARALQEVSRRVREADAEQILESATNVARKRPMLFAAGCAALGFLGARLLLVRR